MDMEKLLIVEEDEFPAIARLIELGRQKSYVTIDDILHFFPEAEQDVEHGRVDRRRQLRRKTWQVPLPSSATA